MFPPKKSKTNSKNRLTHTHCKEGEIRIVRTVLIKVFAGIENQGNTKLNCKDSILIDAHPVEIYQLHWIGS